MASLFVVNNYLYKFQGDAIWENRIEYSSIFDIISHLFFTGTYPLFPWIIFAVIGASAWKVRYGGRRHSQGITPLVYL